MSPGNIKPPVSTANGPCIGACSLTTFSVKRWPRVGLANIIPGENNWKNGSSDLADMGTFKSEFWCG